MVSYHRKHDGISGESPVPEHRGVNNSEGFMVSGRGQGELHTK